MTRLLPLLLALASLLCVRPVAAQTSCEGGVCVGKDDLKVFVQLARDQKCRQETPPKLTSDPLTIVVDREGRIYGSGSDPHPQKLTLSWCNYTIEATSQTRLIAAERVEPTWGFRFRVKAAIGYLPVEAWYEKDGGRGIDGGVLLEPFFLRWANLNADMGVRSVGAGVGFDIFKNMSLYVGYAMAWGTWRSNPKIALAFSLW